MRASIIGRGDHRGERSGATAGLVAEERHGRVVLKVLDSLITPLLGSNDKLLAEWRVARQVRRQVVVPADGPAVLTPNSTPKPAPAAPTPATAPAKPVVPPPPLPLVGGTDAHPATTPAAPPQ